MSANISNVINVSLSADGEIADRDQMNVVAIMTSQQDGTISTANRYERYIDAASVASDFGSDSAMSLYAASFLQHSRTLLTQVEHWSQDIGGAQKKQSLQHQQY